MCIHKRTLFAWSFRVLAYLLSNVNGVRFFIVGNYKTMTSSEFTNGEVKRAAEKMLADQESLTSFAALLNKSNDEIANFLRTMLTNPQMSDEGKKFVWDGEDEKLKAFLAGQEKGESSGFWKGVCAGAGVVLLFLAGAYFFKKTTK